MRWLYALASLEPRFELRVAWRYMLSSRLQTLLIVMGISVGIMVFTFMAALINGLRERIVTDVIGNMAHVTLEPRERIPRLLTQPRDAAALVARQRSNFQRTGINGWRQVVARVEAQPEVTAVAAQAVGSGFIRRAEKIKPVRITGTEPDKVSTIVRLNESMVRGTLTLAPGDVLIGTRLAEEFGVSVGQPLTLRSERGRDRTLTVRGIFEVGNAQVDEGMVFVDMNTAQALLDLTGEVSQIAVKVRDLFAAPSIAERLGAITDLQAKNWATENERLREALRSQASTGELIKGFSILTIVIGVASVLLLAAVRRRAEIGIMRSMGVSKGSITAIFILQGTLLGAVGSITGAVIGFAFNQFMVAALVRADGTPLLPIAPERGEYLIAVLAATICCALASVLPARSAAKVDPVEAIQQ